MLRFSHLTCQIDINHRVGERVREASDSGLQFEHGPVECAVDLDERSLAGIVHIDDWHVAEESEKREEYLEIFTFYDKNKKHN